MSWYAQVAILKASQRTVWLRLQNIYTVQRLATNDFGTLWKLRLIYRNIHTYFKVFKHSTIKGRGENLSRLFCFVVMIRIVAFPGIFCLHILCPVNTTYEFLSQRLSFSLMFHIPYTVWWRYNGVNFLQNLHKRQPIARSSGRYMGSLLLIQRVIYVLLLWLWCGLWYRDIVGRIKTTSDCN